MLEDGNCLFHAVADQVYGDSELYDLVRQMCIDYMVRDFLISYYHKFTLVFLASTCHQCFKKNVLFLLTLTGKVLLLTPIISSLICWIVCIR